MNERKLKLIEYIVVEVTPLQQNASLIFESSTGKGAVVDPGGDIPKILDIITDRKLIIEKILLTHGHVDHAGGASKLRDSLKRNGSLEIPIEGPHIADEPLLNSLSEIGPAYGLTEARSIRPDRWLTDGSKVEIGSIPFKVLHCPGHSPGSVVFYCREEKFAVTGDVIFAGSIGRTDLPFSDPRALAASIKNKVLTLPDDVLFLPGHGKLSSIGEEKVSNFLVHLITKKSYKRK